MIVNKSIWLKGIKNKKTKSLNDNIKTDILIIGGGITGITTLYFLKDSNYKITLVDESYIASGQSSKATGKLTYLQGSIYNKIKNIYDDETAFLYLESQKEAIEIVKKIIINNNIKCDFESNNSFIFTNNKIKIQGFNYLEYLLDKNEIKYKINKKLPIRFHSSYSIRVDDTAVFNPVKYLIQIKELLEKKDNIKVYEGTKIINIENKGNYFIAYTKKNKIETKKIVIACHYPFFINPYFFPFKTSIKKGYLVATTIDKNKRFNAISEENKTESIRYHSDSKDYLIYCGLVDNLKNNIDNEKKYNEIIWEVETNFSDKIKYQWFNTDIITNDSLPLIGYLDKDNKNVLIGTGYNLWGMTNGTIAGKVISDLILKNESKYKVLFDPNRDFNISKLPNIIKNNTTNGISFISSKLSKNPRFYKNVKVITKDGIDYGVYIDQNNKKHMVYNKCPHMGCSLIFNMVDKTWDCPCHASRFNVDGKVVKGPSTLDISIEKNKK